MDLKDLYSETGENWRTLVGWREKIFSGYLTAIAAVAVAFVKIPTPGRRIMVLIIRPPLRRGRILQVVC